MKGLIRILNGLVIVIVLLVLAASIGTALFHKPILLTVIKSNSMYPLWQRGDMLVIRNLSEHSKIHHGDMVVFKSESGTLASKGWIAHRVVGGNATTGFNTKGDANEKSDQAEGVAPAIHRDWIAAKVATFGGQPLVIPKIGYLSLWIGNMNSAKYVLPGIALLLAGLVAYGELNNKRRKKKRGKLELQLIYIGAGLTVMIVAMATMLMNTQFISLRYEVGTQSGILSGSSVGIMPLGDVKSDTLSELHNSSFMPFIGVVSEHDVQLNIDHSLFVLGRDESLNLHYTVHAKKIGNYDTNIKVALFYPFLPSIIIEKLVNVSFWLAIITLSIIPGLPFILYPLLSRRMRRPMVRHLRRRLRKL